MRSVVPPALRLSCAVVGMLVGVAGVQESLGLFSQQCSWQLPLSPSRRWHAEWYVIYIYVVSDEVYECALHVDIAGAVGNKSVSSDPL